MDVCTAFFVATCLLNPTNKLMLQCNPFEQYIVKTESVKCSVGGNPVVSAVKNNRSFTKAKVNGFKGKFNCR